MAKPTSTKKNITRTYMLKAKQRGGPGRGQGRKSPFKEKTKGIKFMCPISKTQELKSEVKKIFDRWSKDGV